MFKKVKIYQKEREYKNGSLDFDDSIAETWAGDEAFYIDANELEELGLEEECGISGEHTNQVFFCINEEQVKDVEKLGATFVGENSYEFVNEILARVQGFKKYDIITQKVQLQTEFNLSVDRKNNMLSIKRKGKETKIKITNWR